MKVQDIVAKLKNLPCSSVQLNMTGQDERVVKVKDIEKLIQELEKES